MTMKPIRVDLCGYDSPVHNGGPLQWLMRVPEAMQERNIDCRIHLFGWNAPEKCLAVRYLKQRGLKVNFTRFKDTKTNIQWLLRQCRINMPQVFVANHVIPAYYASGYLKQAGVATVGVLRSDDDFYNAIMEQFISRKIFFTPTSIVGVSSYLRDKAQAFGSIAATNCRVIPSGAVIPEPIAQPPKEHFHLLYVGRIEEEQKRVSDMVKAMQMAKQTTPKLTAELIGDGPALESVIAYKREQSLDWLEVRGALGAKEVEKAMLRSHCLVLLSEYEGTPMAVMEAMACGLPPVCMNLRSGIPDLIEHEKSGIIVKDRHSDFSAAIARLASDPELWITLSTNARKKAEAQFSVPVCADRWSTLFADLARPSPPKTVSIPKNFRLPPPLAGFARQDQRTPTWIEIKRRALLNRFRAALEKIQSDD